MNAGLDRLKGKVALITGAAQGIGRSIAETFATEGASVVIADVQDGKGEGVARSINERGDRASFVHADVSQEQDIRKMIEFAVQNFGTLHILVNNAAPYRGKVSSPEQAIEDWDANLNVLLKSHVLAVKYALPCMSGSGGGSIVNIASVVAFAITHQPCDYHVAKAGVVHLTRYLAYELGPKGVRVNCICPGLVDREEGARLTSDPINRAVVELSVPLKRAARPRDIAYAALYLCTDEASYITGHSLVVDGGVTLGEPFGVARRAYHQAIYNITGEAPKT